MTPLETVNAFIDKVVSGDLDGACELVTADIEYDNVPIGKNHGPDELKAVFGGLTGGVDSIEFITVREAATGNIVMNERIDRFHTKAGPIDVLVAGVFEVNADGKISLWRDYFDMAKVGELMAAISS